VAGAGVAGAGVGAGVGASHLFCRGLVRSNVQAEPLQVQHLAGRKESLPSVTSFLHLSFPPAPSQVSFSAGSQYLWGANDFNV
jgi:hypothetical protein